MTQREKLYAKRDAMALDEAGNYYINHVMAMGSEQLHSKSAIASELAHRDMLIDKLTKELQAAKAQPQWIPVSERLPEYLKPVWIKSKGKVSQFQWVYDAGDDDCWFEPWTPHFTDGSTLDIDSVEMWAYCDLPPAAPVKDGE